MIKWTGTNTAQNITWTAHGRTYREVFDDIRDKYGYNYIEDADAFEIALLEKNGEDLDAYDVTSDGIRQWELFEQFNARADIKPLDDIDYRDVISNGTSNAYYHKFEVMDE